MAKRTEQTQRTAAGAAVAQPAPGRIVPDIEDLERVGQPIKDRLGKLQKENIPQHLSPLALKLSGHAGLVAANVLFCDSNGTLQHETITLAAHAMAVADLPYGEVVDSRFFGMLPLAARENIVKHGELCLETLTLMVIRATGDLCNSTMRLQLGDCSWREITEKAVEVGEICVQILWCLDRKAKPAAPPVHKCRICGCTDDDCSGCFQRTGQACHWVAPDLCSACEPVAAKMPKPHITKMVLIYGPSTRRRKPAGKGA